MLRSRIDELLHDNAKTKTTAVAQATKNDGHDSLSDQLSAREPIDGSELEAQVEHLLSQNSALSSQNGALAQSLSRTESCLLEVKYFFSYPSS